MKNNNYFKKNLIEIICVSFCIIVLFSLLNIYEYKTYTKNFNMSFEAMINDIVKKYPDVTENDLIQILNSKDLNRTNVLQKYGINLNKNSAILINEKKHTQFLFVTTLFLIISLFILIIIFINYNRKKDREIEEMVDLVEQINRKNYSIKIDNISEDELSILKNEIYKTMIKLKESAENSLQDKKNLKKSLEDISHQIKTPLTSILIMLDNLIDDPNMDIETRQWFIRDIKKNVKSINFLVQSLLKLSKFDTNTVNFIREEKSLSEIITIAKQKVSALCDLKKVKIESNGDENAKIKCDFKWQVEAITNVLKNCVEHSKTNGKIIVTYGKNNAYSFINVKDYGDGIDEYDINHIFERFYKGKNAKEDSIGIGLALSKTIIESDNGKISVESDNTGTKFTIKYYIH